VTSPEFQYLLDVVDDPNDPTNPTPTWIDVSTRTRTGDDVDNPGFTFSRGRDYQLDAAQPGDGNIYLDNHDGALTPSNTASPDRVAVMNRFRIQGQYGANLLDANDALFIRDTSGWEVSASTPAPPSGPTSVIAIPGSTICGMYESGGSFSSVQSMETATSHTYKVVHQYCDFSNTNSGKPGAAGTQSLLAAQAGKIVHIRFDPRIFDNNTSHSAALVAPQAAGGTTTPYANPWFGDDDMLAGLLDPVIAQHAASLSNLPGGPHIISFRDEADLAGRRIEAKLAPHLYPLAVRYYMDGLRANGFTNFEPAWVVAATENNPLNTSASVSTADGTMTVGQLFNTMYGTLDDLIVWIMNDPYWNASGDNASIFLQFYNAVQAGVLTSMAKTKVFGLGEWGIGAGFASNALRQAAFASVNAVCTPVLQLMQYFDSNFGSGAWDQVKVLGTTDGSVGAFTTMVGSANFT
jgi:hypothetical protein